MKEANIGKGMSSQMKYSSKCITSNSYFTVIFVDYCAINHLGSLKTRGKKRENGKKLI